MTGRRLRSSSRTRLAPRLALLTGRVNAVGVLADAGVDPGALRDRLRDTLGTGYKVAGRNNASTADAGDPRAEQRDTTIVVMAMLAGNGGAVTIFVVAGIFGLMIAQRRRELALFRAVGATPGQVRRMIAAEAFVLAILAGLAGLAVGVLAAGPIASMLVERRHRAGRAAARLGLRSHADRVLDRPRPGRERRDRGSVPRRPRPRR